MIETRLLHYFLAIAREQNITKAAENVKLRLRMKAIFCVTRGSRFLSL